MRALAVAVVLAVAAPAGAQTPPPERDPRYVTAYGQAMHAWYLLEHRDAKGKPVALAPDAVREVRAGLEGVQRALRALKPKDPLATEKLAPPVNGPPEDEGLDARGAMRVAAMALVDATRSLDPLEANPRAAKERTAAQGHFVKAYTILAAKLRRQ